MVDAVAGMRRLAATLATTLAPGEPGPRRARAALHLLDWLGNAALGATVPVGLGAARWLALQSPGAAPTLAGRAADPAAAAAYHGALGSLHEMDDVHRSAILHTGPVVVPAALAAAAAASASASAGGSAVDGARLLDAVVLGVEAMVRVGRTLGPAHYRLWHSTSTAGGFGAAAAAAHVLGLDEAATAQALALAGTRGGGLWQVRHEGSQGKAWHMAAAAREGLAAAQLAACGWTGPLGVIEGPSGWLAATTASAASAAGAEGVALDEPRAKPWLWDLSFKPWPACRHAHPAMDALRGLLVHTPVAPAQVHRIEVHTYADALRFCERVHPGSEAQARFSIPHALAAWLTWGEPTLAHYRESALTEPAVAALRERVHLAEDAAIEARYPAHYGARVVVVLDDGHRLEHAVHDTWGDPACPMPDAAIEAKARHLMQAAGWDAARIDAAVAACAALPEAATLRALDSVLLGTPATPCRP